MITFYIINNKKFIQETIIYFYNQIFETRNIKINI